MIFFGKPVPTLPDHARAEPDMTKGWIAFVLTAFVLATSASPSMAYDWLRRPHIYEGYKAPIIRQLRADIYKLRATLYPADWEWATPCCYGRPPIHIR